MNLKISIVIPAKNEGSNIELLIRSLFRQTLRVDEVIVVDGGSSDDTPEIVDSLAREYPFLRLIRPGLAGPGRGRNIGIVAARNEWIALTDAGINLNSDWIEQLMRERNRDENISVVYGNYAPVVDGFFSKCAAISYVPPQAQSGIRGKFIASSLIRKSAWVAAGGFPDLRAAEDLIFMERVQELGFVSVEAPMAMVHWQLRPDLSSTFRKFVLYSKHNVWAGRTWDWHYGIAKQYLLLLPFIVLAFVISPWFLIALPLWLGARTAKRILSHRFEFGIGTLFNPLIVIGVAGLILTIDAATFIGWIQALIQMPPEK